MGLLDILKDEKELLLNMLDTLKAEKEALINDNIDKIQETAKKKEELKLKIDDLEIRRVEECGNRKLKDLLPLLDEKERDQVESIGKEIENAVFGIQEINKVNCLLIKQSLNYIRAVMNLMSPPKAKVYNSNGAVNNNNPSVSSMLDRSI